MSGATGLATAPALAGAQTAPPTPRGRSRRRARMGETLIGYSFAGPNLLLLLVFLLYPYAMWLSAAH